MKFNIVSSIIFLLGSVKSCAHVTFHKGFISVGISTVVLQDGGHRFYKKFSGNSDIYAIIDSQYLDDEDCVVFSGSLLDPGSSIGIYNYSNDKRTVASDAAIYYYPTTTKAKSFLKG